MKKSNLNSLLLDLTNIVNYNHGGVSYKAWNKPQIKENIDWFTSKGSEKNISLKIAAHNDELLSERLMELINRGLDLKDKAYIIANVNSPLFLKAALDNGADPNIPSPTGQFLIDFTISKGMHSTAKIIIDHPNFNWQNNNDGYPNILFKCVVFNKFDLAQFIAQKKPEYILRKADEPSIGYLISNYLSLGDNISGKDTALKLFEYCANYANGQNMPYDVNEEHQGKTLLENSFEASSIIKRIEAESLSKTLGSEIKSNLKKIKI
jgi:hypothetical protein